MKYNNLNETKQRDAQIMLAVLCAEKLLPMYEYCYTGDYRPHKAVAIAMQYIEADDIGARAKLEIDAELAMLEVNSARGRDWTGVANVAWHVARAVVYPARTAESANYARHFASRIIDRAGVICARLGEPNRYATDFDKLEKQAIAIIEDK